MTSPLTTPASPAAGSDAPAPETDVSTVQGSGGAVVDQVTIGSIEAEAVTAVQVGLGSANAAVWAYGLISAYDADDITLIRSCRLANEQVRDSSNDLLSSAGVAPNPTQVAYQLPVTVTDRATALQVAVAIEKDCTNAWRAVVGQTDNYQLRKFALTALSDAAVRLTGWRALAAVAPVTVPFPGNES